MFTAQETALLAIPKASLGWPFQSREEIPEQEFRVSKYPKGRKRNPTLLVKGRPSALYIMLRLAFHHSEAPKKSRGPRRNSPLIFGGVSLELGASLPGILRSYDPACEGVRRAAGEGFGLWRSHGPGFKFRVRII